MKRLFFIILMFALSFYVFADIREAVCIVYPEYSDELIESVDIIAEKFENIRLAS